jgi:hypothetical protein
MGGSWVDRMQADRTKRCWFVATPVAMLVAILGVAATAWPLTAPPTALPTIDKAVF